MEEELEIPKWVEKIMRMWVRDAAKPLPKEVRDMWREVHRKKAEQLKQVDRDKLDGWQREWIQWLLESNEKAAQETQDEETGDSEDVPIWYENLTQVVVEAYTPTIKFKALLQGRPSQSMAITCGEWVGHEYMIWCEENMAVTAALERFPAELRDAIIRQNQYLQPQRLKWLTKRSRLRTNSPLKNHDSFSGGTTLRSIKERSRRLGSLAAATTRRRFT